MTRTRHGSKGPGYEYWSRRPCKLRYPDPGRYAKTVTHRAERLADHAAERAAALEARMPEDDPDRTAPIDVFKLVEFLSSLGDGIPLSKMIELRADIEAGTVVLTDREKQILATLGLIVGHAAHDHAARMFQREAPSMLAAMVARMRDDDEPGSVQ